MMQKFVFIFATSFAAASLSGCLKTRGEASDLRPVAQQSTISQQKIAVADSGSRMSDLEEQIRYLNGRVEVVENKQSTGNTGLENALKNSQSQSNESGQKLAIMQEALTKMEAQVFALTAEFQGLRAEKSASAAQAAVQTATKKDHYEAGQDYFSKKDWKKAILSYQKYRDESSKGKYYPEATYKIGVSFQELGMKEEAKTFYEEVVSKFPRSEQSRKAATRLKSLKK